MFYYWIECFIIGYTVLSLDRMFYY